ncbi:unnamed protein product, partial [Lampetra fluviatilis]
MSAGLSRVQLAPPPHTHISLSQRRAASHKHPAPSPRLSPRDDVTAGRLSRFQCLGACLVRCPRRGRRGRGGASGAHTETRGAVPGAAVSPLRPTEIAHGDSLDSVETLTLRMNMLSQL